MANTNSNSNNKISIFEQLVILNVLENTTNAFNFFKFVAKEIKEKFVSNRIDKLFRENNIDKVIKIISNNDPETKLPDSIIKKLICSKTSQGDVKMVKAILNNIPDPELKKVCLNQASYIAIIDEKPEVLTMLRQEAGYMFKFTLSFLIAGSYILGDENHKLKCMKALQINNDEQDSYISNLIANDDHHGEASYRTYLAKHANIVNDFNDFSADINLYGLIEEAI